MSSQHGAHDHGSSAMVAPLLLRAAVGQAPFQVPQKQHRAEQVNILTFLECLF